MSQLADLQDELTKLKTARDAILGGAQSYSINGQSVTRADLGKIFDRIDLVESRISAMQRRGRGGFIKAPLFMD